MLSEENRKYIESTISLLEMMLRENNLSQQIEQVYENVNNLMFSYTTPPKQKEDMSIAANLWQHCQCGAGYHNKNLENCPACGSSLQPKED